MRARCVTSKMEINILKMRQGLFAQECVLYVFLMNDVRILSVCVCVCASPYYIGQVRANISLAEFLMKISGYDKQAK